jgi:hypothetical protein
MKEAKMDSLINVKNSGSESKIVTDKNNNKNEDHELVIASLVENLDHLKTVDTSLLIKPNDESHFPIGMKNFKSKIKHNRSWSNFAVSSNVLDSKENKSSLIRKRWQRAAMKIKLLKDPWYEFKIESYPVEFVTRHRYNPIKKEWKKDKVLVVSIIFIFTMKPY